MRRKRSPFNRHWKSIRKICSNGYRRKSMAWILSGTMMITTAFGGAFIFADTQILDADVRTPSEGCILAGLAGSYYAEDQAALDRINEIRQEACSAGNVPDPRNPSRMLTSSDYSPIQWSADLERIARIRAYESSVTFNHLRLNGKSIWSVSSNGIQSFGEVLAWTGRSSMISGINLWYEEKSDWVSQNSNVVTGHYTQMIDPSNTYVGLGGFCPSQGRYNTTSGEFCSTSSSLDTTMLDIPEGIVIQKVEVLLSEILNYNLSTDNCDLQVGETEQLTLSAEVDFSRRISLLILDGIDYRSSDPHVVSVSENGVLTANNPGETNITALVNGTEAATLKIAVLSPDKTAAAEVTNLINSIGEVSLDSGEAIHAAREAYNALTADQKALISDNIKDTLIAAETVYSEMVAAKAKTEEDKKAAENVESMINTIGLVTANSGEAIHAAREAYNALTADQKALIPENVKNTLIAAETAYSETIAAKTKTEEDKKAAENVESMINTIGIVTANSDEAIHAAREAYNALTADQKTLVSTEIKNRLIEAETEYASLQKQNDTDPGNSSNTPEPSDDNLGNNYFKDVNVNDYFFDAVIWAVNNKITIGTSLTTFSPDNGCTRAQVVAFLWRVAGSPAITDKSSFSDVPNDEYYTEAVIWAVNHGITNGVGNNRFDPDATCTRAQIVTFLWRYKGNPSASKNTGFSDVSSNQYYAASVSWAVKNGITNGVGNSRFGPDATCTRAQVVTFLYRSKDL